MKILISDPFSKDLPEKLSEFGEVTDNKEELPEANIVLVRSATKATKEYIDSAMNLQMIIRGGVGIDNIDVGYAKSKGIAVHNTPEASSIAVAELAIAMMLAIQRNVVRAHNTTKNGEWIKKQLKGQELYKKTLGLIGIGLIGTEVAKRARGFDMKILYYSRTRKTPEEEEELGLEYVDLMPELLSRSDFISLHVPLTDETRGLIGAEEFAMMKPTAIFVNASRGLVVDQQALYNALKTGQILSAAIDVTEVEPIPMDDPLLTLDNLVITPHIGSASVLTRTTMAFMAADNLLAGLRGETPPDCVNF